jgi:hypothetical protein
MELERGRVAMENAPPQAAPQAAQQQQRANDPVEALASQLSSKSADWVRKNPQCVTDPRLYQKMVAAHNLAVADGYSPDSDDYFGFIEDTLKINQRRQAPARVETETDDPLSSASAPAQRRSAPPAAPVTRAGTANGQRPDVVRLSRAEAETARDLGMTEQEYARNKQLLKKEGRL